MNTILNMEQDKLLGTVHNFSDGLYARQMHIPKGHVIVTHKHNYSHLSILAQGKVLLTQDDGSRVMYEAPTCIEITAGVKHGIETLEDTVWFCVHATSVTELDEIDNVLIGE